MKLGIIGTGFVGSAYGRYFDSRGAFEVVRYSLDPQYAENSDDIPDCDIVLVCVPTPTIDGVQDLNAVMDALCLVGEHQLAIIKSTVLPGSAQRLQQEYQHIRILSSPEFLSEATADQDVARPILTLIGTPKGHPRPGATAEFLSVMPHIPGQTFEMSSTEAELVKYAHNVSGYLNILLYNLLYDVSKRHNGDWTKIRTAVLADPYMASQYSQPNHKSGRGAGGHCFLKDFEAFRQHVGPGPSADFLREAVGLNVELLLRSGKSLAEVEAVYGNFAEEKQA